MAELFEQAMGEDTFTVVLRETHAAALCQLKATSLAWRARARHELCHRLWARLSRREGQPAPAGVGSITDLDVQCLNDTGRPSQVVVAGRDLPNLARLHGFGFVVDLRAVREADLDFLEDWNPGGPEYRFWEREDDPLDDDALRRCIVPGEGDPPQELLLAAVACAARGTVREVPVQRLRRGRAIDEEDSASDEEDRAIDELEAIGMGITGVTLLGLMLPAALTVRSLEYATNPNPNHSP